MGKLKDFGQGSVIIRVYANDHLPPHFHILSADNEALVEIATLAVLAGSLPTGKNGRAARDWAKNNIDAIAAEWNRVNPRFPI